KVVILESVAAQIATAIETAKGHYDKYEFSKALEAIWVLIGQLDKLIMEEKPWELAKKGENERLDSVLTSCYRALQVICDLTHSVLPVPIEKIPFQLGTDVQVGALTPVFPRLDSKVVIPQMEAGEQAELARQNAL